MYPVQATAKAALRRSSVVLRKNNEGEKKKNRSSPFSEAVRTYGHLLYHNYDRDAEERHRRCVRLILDSLIETLTLRKIADDTENKNALLLQDLKIFLSRCLRTFGVGDALLREQILQTIEKTGTEAANVTPNQSLLESVQETLIHFLPCTFGDVSNEIASQQVMRTFRVLFVPSTSAAIISPPPSQHSSIPGDHDISSDGIGRVRMQFLRRLTIVPLDDFALSQVSNDILRILPTSSMQDFPYLVSCIISFSSTPPQLVTAVAGIRHSWRRFEQIADVNGASLLSATSVVIARTIHVMDASRDGCCESEEDIAISFQQSYLESLRGLGGQQQDEEQRCLTLDLAYLLYMQRKGSDYANQMARVVASWVETNCFPFDALKSICRLLLGSRTDFHRGCPDVEDETTERKFSESQLAVIWDVLVQSLVKLAFALVTDFEWGLSVPVSERKGRLSAASSSMADQTVEFVLYLHNNVLANLPQWRTMLSQSLLKSWKSEVFQQAEGEDKQLQQRRITKQAGRIIEEMAKHCSTAIDGSWDLFAEVLCTSLDCCSGFVIVQTCCEVLSSLGCASQHHEAKLIRFLQKLLFSNNPKKWTSRGIILAVVMIQNGLSSDQAMDYVKQDVLQTVLPPTRKMIEPELGPPCLAFLQAWEQRKGPKSVFKEFQMLLSNTGLIQSLSHYNKQVGKRKYTAILGFSKHQHKQFPILETSYAIPQMPSMVFCVAYFIRSIDAKSAERFAATTKWVFELVDTYLETGRKGTTNQWRVASWLAAPIELPKLSVNWKATTEQQHSAVQWLKQELCCFELSFEEGRTVADDMHGRIVDLITQDFCTQEMGGTVCSLFESSLSLYVAAGVLAAVAKNAFAHYKSLPDDDVQKGATLRLIGHHLLKALEIRKRCKSLRVFVDCIEIAMRRKSKPANYYSKHDGSDPNHTHVITGSEQKASTLKDIFNFMEKEVFCSSKYFGHDMLLECLNDEWHDQLLGRSLSCDGAQSTLPPNDVVKVTYILDFKQRLLDQLLLCHAVESESENHFPRCLRSLITLVGIVPKISEPRVRSTGTSLSALTDHEYVSLPSLIRRVAVSYLHLLISALSREPKLGMGSFQQAFLRKIDYDRANQFKILSRMHDMVRETDDLRVASGLLELMSFYLTEGDEDILRVLVDTSFQVLHTQYAHFSNECSKKFIPFSIRCIPRSLKLPATSLQVVQRILAQTVWRSSNAPAKELGKAVELQRTLLFRHFGLLYHSKEKFCLFYNHIYGLISSLDSLVDDLSLVKNQKNTIVSDHVSLVDIISDGKGERDTVTLASTTRSMMKTDTGVSCLTGSTLPGFFETLLHISVASFAVFQPESPTTFASPYSSIQDAAALFNTLIIMYAENLNAFPRKTVAVVLQASRLTMEALSLQIRHCTEWRITQPISNTQPDDLGSLTYFQELIDFLASSICSSLYYLGTCWIREDDVSTSQKGKNLCASVDKAKKLLKDAALTHKLDCPCFEVKKVHKSRLSQAPKEENPSSGDLPSKRRRLTTTAKQTTSDSEAAVADEGQKYEDTEFAATGNWGAEESDDETKAVATPRIRRSL
ncbi:hypothetical protein ACA910_018179 [Epithemia clementina (nom. ined.)]